MTEKRRVMKFGVKALVLAVVLGLCGCTEKTPEQQAIDTVLESFEGLIEGDYEAFLNGRSGMDDIPDSYREQLLVAYKQFIHQQRKAHGDISSIVALRTQTDPVARQMLVFLMVNYADSTNEEIVVPMVEDADGLWKMK